MATPSAVVDAAMQLLSYLGAEHKRVRPHTFTARGYRGPHPRMHAECEKAAFEHRAWYRLVAALGNADEVRKVAEGNATLSVDVPTEEWMWGRVMQFPERMSLYLEPDRRCLQRISRMLASDRGLATAYGNMAALMLAALEMHPGLRFYGSWSPHSSAHTLSSLPVVFPRLEVVDGTTFLCLTIELGRIASDEAYVEWARQLKGSNTSVVILQPRHFSTGLFSAIRRRLRSLAPGTSILRVKRGNDRVEEIELGDVDREAHVVSGFWSPTALSASTEDNEFESESIWGNFGDMYLDLATPEGGGGWCDLIRPQVSHLRESPDARHVDKRPLPWPRSIRDARKAVVRA
jgi:hypothetical protein